MTAYESGSGSDAERDGSISSNMAVIDSGGEGHQEFSPEDQKIYEWLFALGRAVEHQRKTGPLRVKRLPNGFITNKDGSEIQKTLIEDDMLIIFVPCENGYYNLYFFNREVILGEMAKNEMLLKGLEKIKTENSSVPQEISRDIKEIRRLITETKAIMEKEKIIKPDFTMLVTRLDDMKGVKLELQEKIREWGIARKMIIVEKRTVSSKKTTTQAWDPILLEARGLDASWVDKALFPPIQEKPRAHARAARRTRKSLIQRATKMPPIPE